eukprot:6204568-Pleurochrysis_carterae.AAC.3
MPDDQACCEGLLRISGKLSNTDCMHICGLTVAIRLFCSRRQPLRGRDEARLTKSRRQNVHQVQKADICNGMLADAPQGCQAANQTFAISFTAAPHAIFLNRPLPYHSRCSLQASPTSPFTQCLNGKQLHTKSSVTFASKPNHASLCRTLQREQRSKRAMGSDLEADDRVGLVAEDGGEAAQHLGLHAFKPHSAGEHNEAATAPPWQRRNLRARLTVLRCHTRPRRRPSFQNFAAAPTPQRRENGSSHRKRVHVQRSCFSSRRS